MATLLIRRLDDEIKNRLRRRAAAHGRSMEEEARTILQDNLRELPDHSGNSGQRLLAVIRESFGPLGGVDLELPPRDPDWEPPRFDE